MSTGVTTLDHTIQETNVWLKGVEEELELDSRHQGYSALRAVLHALRDRLPPEVAIKLGAQLPILVRGIYYEGWHAAGTPTRERHVEDFAEHVVSSRESFRSMRCPLRAACLRSSGKSWILASSKRC